MATTRPGMTSWKPVAPVLRSLAATPSAASSAIGRADFKAPIATTFVPSGLSSRDYRDVQHANVCNVPGVADGWIFIAMPFNGLWAWNPSCGTRTELIRDASVPLAAAAPASAGKQPPAPDGNRPAKSHRPESGLLPQPAVAAPSAAAVVSNPLPLALPNDGALAFNSVAVVPSGTADATVTVLSIVNGQLHALYLKCEKRSSVHTLRLISSAFIPLGSTRLTRLASWGWTPESPSVFIDGVSFSVAGGARSHTRRTSLLVHLRGRSGNGERASGVGVVTFDSPGRTASLACPWILGVGKSQEVHCAAWLTDPDHHIVCMTGKCDLSLYAVDASDRIGSATIEGRCRMVIPPTPVTTSPIANLHCWHNAPEHSSLIAVVSADNALQLLSVAPTVLSFMPVSGMVYPPLTDRFDDVFVVDEEHCVAATTDGNIVVVSNLGPEVVKIEKLSAPSVVNTEFDRVKIVALQPESGLTVALGNALVLVRT